MEEQKCKARLRTTFIELPLEQSRHRDRMLAAIRILLYDLSTGEKWSAHCKWRFGSTIAKTSNRQAHPCLELSHAVYRNPASANHI